jgi:predicted nucleotidyltransferase
VRRRGWRRACPGAACGAGFVMSTAGTAVEAIQRYARTLSASVVEAAGADAVETVFVGGSVARGEVAAYRSDEGLEVYSDVDLYVVLAEGADEDTARTAARKAVATADVPEGVHMMSSADVGVYTKPDLLAQPSRPGTAYLDSQHWLLYGSEGLFADLSRHVGREMDPREGLYLIENRLSELARLPATARRDAERRLRRYTLLKTALDIAGALLVARGQYEPTLEARGARLAALAASSEPLPDGWDDGLVREATSGVRDLQAYLDSPPTTDLGERVRGFGVEVWGAIASEEFPDAMGDWAAMILCRCNATNYRLNFRQFVAMGAGLGLARSRLLWAGLHLSRYAPVDALRLFALAESVGARPGLDGVGRRALESLRGFLDRLTATCGFDDGPLEARVDAMHRAVT